MNKRLLPWIRKHLPKLKLVTVGVGAMALAACATTPVTGTTSSVPAGTPTVSKTSFIAWGTACNAFTMAEITATTAINAHKVPVSAFPVTKDAQATVTPLCSAFPANPATAIAQIQSATAGLAVQALINATSGVTKP
jgi:hypothetical protein